MVISPSTPNCEIKKYILHIYIYIYLVISIISIKLPLQLREVIYLFVSVALICPIHEKDNFIENLYIVLSCLIK